MFSTFEFLKLTMLAASTRLGLWGVTDTVGRRHYVTFIDISATSNSHVADLDRVCYLLITIPITNQTVIVLPQEIVLNVDANYLIMEVFIFSNCCYCVKHLKTSSVSLGCTWKDKR
ncbi:hypothetical protein LOAG_07504 [Loa loa]|uniref:Uncharacterized protein n=1 Tax=Loa loa TaxID=7209 RepID=A0A1S0TX59_LOALO|nr:hypothetical protein LOAG_07504 [Loa loa]EFO20990.1 hypothetical protein LOAG_07504 [Loa loa]